jgi:hypothetical protein
VIEPVLPGAVRQVGYVVHDLDRAIESFLRIGVGPWLTMREIAQSGCRYRGDPCAPVLSIGLTNSADLQLEIIQQVDDAPSVYREFLDAGREGYHQLAWWVDDFDATCERAALAGWTVAFEGDGNGAARFCYFDADPLVATVYEIMELNDMTRWMIDRVRRAADTWQPGSDDVRPLF